MTIRRPIRVQPAPRSETEAFTVRSYPRVAEMLGIPQATVYRLEREAIRKMREAWELLYGRFER